MKRPMETLLGWAAMALFPTLAWAHAEADQSGAVAGFLHPIMGYDHLLAMLSVGIVSAQLGGRAIWTVPALFVSFMVVGGVLGAEGLVIPYVEVGIAVSVVALGLAIVAAHTYRNVPLTMAFVAFFGSLHGYAHGVEMPSAASPVFYSFGFVVSTSLIHLAGVFIGHFLASGRRLEVALRYVGATVTSLGCVILYNLAS